MGGDARFFLTTKDGACTLGINAEGDPYRPSKHVGVGLGGNSLPPRKDQWRREGFRRYGHWLIGETDG